MDSMFFLNGIFNGLQCVGIHNIMEVTFGLPSGDQKHFAKRT